MLCQQLTEWYHQGRDTKYQNGIRLTYYMLWLLWIIIIAAVVVVTAEHIPTVELGTQLFRSSPKQDATPTGPHIQCRIEFDTNAVCVVVVP